MVQIIIGAIIIAIGFFVFRFFPMEKDVKSLTKAAVIIIIAVILKRLSIMVPLFGAESLKIGFELIPMMIAGMILSPGYCFLIGIGVDAVGLMTSPTGAIFLGFTLNSILQPVIPSLCMEGLKRQNENRLKSFVMIVVALVCVFVLGFIWTRNSVEVGDAIFQLTLVYKIIFSGIILLLYGSMLGTVTFIKKKSSKDLKILYIWILAVLFVEVLITFLLTPYWLEVMYGIPYFLSFAIRVFKAFVMIPLDIVIGFIIIKMLKTEVYRRVAK